MKKQTHFSVQALSPPPAVFPSSSSGSAPASFLPLGALQQRILGLQLRQLPAQAVHFVLELFVVFDDVDHFVVGLVQTLGRAAPAQKHSCDNNDGAKRKGGAYSCDYYYAVTSTATV